MFCVSLSLGQSEIEPAKAPDPAECSGFTQADGGCGPTSASVRWLREAGVEILVDNNAKNIVAGRVERIAPREELVHCLKGVGEVCQAASEEQGPGSLRANN